MPARQETIRRGSATIVFNRNMLASDKGSERVIKKGALQLPSFFACLRLYSTINLCVVLFFPLIIAMV